MIKKLIKTILNFINKIINIMRDENEIETTSPASENYNKKYIKKDYLLTFTELKFYKLLKSITDELNLVVCPQVPLYEIVKNKDFKDFNKIQSKSIDFVITEQNLKIKICIELDDYSHNQAKRIKRDEFINKLFKDLDVKLLRVPVQNYYDLEELKNRIQELI